MNKPSNKYHTFRIETEYKDSGEVSFTVEKDANISEVLENFERFLLAVGYSLPIGGTVGVVYPDPEPSVDVPEEDLTLRDFKGTEAQSSFLERP
jgi:hypothetical protein